MDKAELWKDLRAKADAAMKTVSDRSEDVFHALAEDSGAASALTTARDDYKLAVAQEFVVNKPVGNNEKERERDETTRLAWLRTSSSNPITAAWATLCAAESRRELAKLALEQERVRLSASLDASATIQATLRAMACLGG